MSRPTKYCLILPHWTEPKIYINGQRISSADWEYISDRFEASIDALHPSIKIFDRGTLVWSKNLYFPLPRNTFCHGFSKQVSESCSPVTTSVLDLETCLNWMSITSTKSICFHKISQALDANGLGHALSVSGLGRVLSVNGFSQNLNTDGFEQTSSMSPKLIHLILKFIY